MNMNEARRWAGAMVVFGACLCPCIVTAVSSSLVQEGGGGTLAYAPYANQGETNVVNTIPDFSKAGYMGGGLPLPTNVPVKVVVYPGAGDDTLLIQSAIDQVSAMTPDTNGFRGAVLLTAGRYQVSNTLYIEASGVVLRGEGQDELGTVLELTDTRSYIGIIARNPNNRDPIEIAGTRQTITTPYVPVGAYSFNVADASGYSVGDWIILERTPNDAWIDAIGQTGDWLAADYVVDSERYITGISGNTITVDVPIMDVIQDQYGGGAIFKSLSLNRNEKCGVEHLRLESTYASATDELHAKIAVQFVSMENSWVRNVTAQYFWYACVKTTGNSLNCTIQDCAFLDPKSQITGGRRYSFVAARSERTLFQRCYANKGRHDFVLGARVTGPIAFVDCYSVDAYADTGPHQRWATGGLFDNVNADFEIRVQNRRYPGIDQGWSGAQMVFWNCKTAQMVCDAPTGAMNFAIGAKAKKVLSEYNPGEPVGWWEDQSLDVTPRSLYFRQLQDRLGTNAVNAVTLPMQRTSDTIWSQLAAWKGAYAFQDNPIDTLTPADQTLQVGSDLVFTVAPLPGATIVKYQWYETIGGAYSSMGGDSPTLTIPNAQPADGGRKFFCRVTTSAGPFWSRTATIFPVPVLLGRWQLDESSGTTAADSGTANGVQNGALINFAGNNSQWVAGETGNALEFDGVDSRVEIADATVANGFDPRNNFTWATWVKTPSVATQTGIMAFDPPGGLHQNGNMILSVVPGGKVSLRMCGIGVANDYSSVASIDDGQWHHVAVTVQHNTQGTDDTIKVYIDGSLAKGYSTTSFNTVLDGINVSSFVHVLGHNENVSNPSKWDSYAGLLDDVRIYDGILSDQQIAALVSPPSPASPLIGSGLDVAGGNFNFQFTGAVGSHYIVEYTPVLPAAGPWQTVTDIVSLAASPCVISIPATNETGFYRVGLVLP